MSLLKVNNFIISGVPQGTVVSKAQNHPHRPSPTTPGPSIQFARGVLEHAPVSLRLSTLIVEVQGPVFVPTNPSFGCSQIQRHCLPLSPEHTQGKSGTLGHLPRLTSFSHMLLIN